LRIFGACTLAKKRTHRGCNTHDLLGATILQQISQLQRLGVMG
jgi:hypothetical protein